MCARRHRRRRQRNERKAALKKEQMQAAKEGQVTRVRHGNSAEDEEAKQEEFDETNDAKSAVQTSTDDVLVSQLTSLCLS